MASYAASSIGRVFSNMPGRMCGVAHTNEKPARLSPSNMRMPSSGVFAPSSMAGKKWQWRSMNPRKTHPF